MADKKSTTAEELQREVDRDFAAYMAKVPRRKQTQMPLDWQLFNLVGLANKSGLYDAADVVKTLLANNRGKDKNA